MTLGSSITTFYAGLPALGTEVVSRMGWQMLSPEDGKKALGGLAKRGVFGVVPFLTTPSGTMGLVPEPGQDLAQATCVLVYPEAAEAITLGDTYADWLAGLLVYEDWLYRERTPSLDRSLAETAAELGPEAATQVKRLLAAAAEVKALKNRWERIALGFQRMRDTAHWALLAQLWRNRRELAVQAAGAYVREYGMEWRLPLRVFTAFLALRKAPIRLEQYREPILLDQQLCDVTYSGNHHGNVPGSWSDRSEVLFAQWLIRLDRLASDDPWWPIVRALAEAGPDYDGKAHAELAQEYFRERPAVAWYLGQAASVYAGSDRYRPLLRQLCSASGWKTHQKLFDYLDENDIG
jgi:hypothetical protein